MYSSGFLSNQRAQSHAHAFIVNVTALSIPQRKLKRTSVESWILSKNDQEKIDKTCMMVIQEDCQLSHEEQAELENKRKSHQVQGIEPGWPEGQSWNATPTWWNDFIGLSVRLFLVLGLNR